jgi:hypothetical protein
MERNVLPQIRSLQKWINKRKERGAIINADEVWKEINRSWRWMEQKDREKIFEGVKL